MYTKYELEERFRSIFFFFKRKSKLYNFLRTYDRFLTYRTFFLFALLLSNYTGKGLYELRNYIYRFRHVSLIFP